MREGARRRSRRRGQRRRSASRRLPSIIFSFTLLSASIELAHRSRTRSCNRKENVFLPVPRSGPSGLGSRRPSAVPLIWHSSVREYHSAHLAREGHAKRRYRVENPSGIRLALPDRSASRMPHLSRVAFLKSSRCGSH